MKHLISSALLLALLLTASNVFADSPPDNTIPIMGLKPSFYDMGTDFLCMLSWHYFDGLSAQFHNASDILTNLTLPGDTTGMLTAVNPWRMTNYSQLWGHMYAMNTDSAYALPVWNGREVGGITYTSDSIINRMSPALMKDTLESVADDLEDWFNQQSHSVWFYYGYDEGPAKQWCTMINDTTEYDNNIPSFFTQQMDSVYRPDLDSTWRWQPTMEEVDNRGLLSWLGYHVNQADTTREMSYVLSCMHTITEWAGMDNTHDWRNDSCPPTPTDQAATVRAILTMQYQGYASSGSQPLAVDNYPSFIALDAYPFRHVGTVYQDTASYTPTLGSSLENWMIDHYEECMDSTFIPAWEIRNDPGNDVSVFFVPQSFGRSGGPAMWSGDSLLYNSYAYRIPTPAEFRMTCNSALLRGAKAILPYCMVSYTVGENASARIDAGLLDQNNIPFDAPYEEWVYRDRPSDDINFIPPDSIPPFMSGYDPLCTLPSRPILVPGDQRNTEKMLMWKFTAYGRLWRSVRSTFTSIARVAPELALLNWWEDRYDKASIAYDGTEPSMFSDPQIRVFTDNNENRCYLYYLNRYCRANDNPFTVTVSSSDFPANTPFSRYALDHSRRFLVEGDSTGAGTYSFDDTLDAGEARLLQMISGSIPRDVRITDPDVFVVLPTDSDTLSDYQSFPGTAVNVHARFYNMSTYAMSNIFVYLKDETTGEMLDTARVSFDGLDASSCYEYDRDEAVFTWTPDSTDIGVHRLLVYTASIPFEHDTEDNDACLVYVVKPRNYATEILNDPWDMTEAASSPPSWKTDDITALTGWNTIFTDSISGMFEGTITNVGSSNSMVLNTGSGSSDYIDTSLYENITIAGKAEKRLDIIAHWMDEDTVSHYVDLGVDLDTTWTEIGPVNIQDLMPRWDDKDAMQFSLEFKLPTAVSPADVRIGWIRLTE